MNNKTTVEVTIKFNVSVWDCIKMRIAGVKEELLKKAEYN